MAKRHFDRTAVSNQVGFSLWRMLGTLLVLTLESFIEIDSVI